MTLLSSRAQAADRLALVIGMGNYRYDSLADLKNAVRDANAIAETLEGIGFEVVRVIDRPLEDLNRTLTDFATRAEVADLAMVYFAGHGVQIDGENYLLPMDARVRTYADVAAQSISLKRFLAAVDRARSMRIVILDSCRDNPWAGMADVAGGMRQPTGTAEASVGLAPASPDRGTLVAYSAKEGRAASDGVGDHSPFAIALMETLVTPGLEISLMFRKVRDDVLRATRNIQEPHTYGSLSSEPFYFAGPAPGDKTLPQGDRTEAWASLRPEQEPMLIALAETGDTRSMVGLAYRRLKTAGDPDPVEAAALFQRAADAGSPVAQFELAKLYEQGIGVARDPKKALALFQASADQEFADALNDLGFLHHEGHLGLKPDEGVAISYFRRAADQRHPEAQFNYAFMIDTGRVAGKGPQEAAGYLFAALRSGNSKVLDFLLTSSDMFSLPTRQALQALLKERNFYDGAIDGSFGPGTGRGLRLAYGAETVQ